MRTDAAAILAMRILVLAGVGPLASGAKAAAAALMVFRDGRALMPVYVAERADPEERDAATELARVLGLMSGLSWPVRVESRGEAPGFYVGRTAAAKQAFAPLRPAADLLAPGAGEINSDGFLIESRNGRIFVEGATPEATGFAVAWLLQREGGARWYAPGVMGEVIPRRTEWSLPEMRIVREPAYVSREIYGLETPGEKAWARRNGLRGRLEFSHALIHVFPPELLAAHPDWAPLLRGRRYRPTSEDDYNWQPNLALPEVAARAAESASAAFARDPQRASFSLAMNDTVRFDQSGATRALVEPMRYFRGMPDYSPLVFTFMNRAAESVAQTNPNRYLGCLAYFWCENTPSFPVNPHVVPYVTTDRTQFYDSDYRASDLALMSRWGGSGVKAFGLWEYGYGRGFLVPRIPNRELAEAVREGWRRGARGYFAEVEPQWGFDTFKTWMLAQVLWDPERPFEDLAADFYAGYYGAAAGPMRQFFECCEAQWMAQPGPPYWLKFYRQQDQALLFPPETCRKLRGLLAAAARAAGNDAPVAARVALTSRAFAVTDAYVAFDATRRKLAAAEDDPGREAAIAESIGCLVRERAHLEAAFNEAGAGDSPAMAQADLANFVRDDPVPRLLWLAGRRDPSAPRRVLRAAGPEAMGCRPWRGLADAIGGRQVAAAPNLDADSSFAETKPEGQEPRFLFPHSGDVPAGWEVRAMPTESGRVSLVGAGGEAPGRAVRIEGAWDTQIYQWLPAEPGRVYVATARLRGRSSPGNDAALFLTFLDQDGKVAGFRRMASLPKGETPAWRSMALADPAPGGAAWVGIGVGSARQVRGDWFEAARLELRAVKL